MTGKGSGRRPLKTDRETFETNWDRVFSPRGDENSCPLCGTPVKPHLLDLAADTITVGVLQCACYDLSEEQRQALMLADLAMDDENADWEEGDE